MKDINKLIGKRILIRVIGEYILELEVLEISKNKEFFKVKNLEDHIFWQEYNPTQIVDILD